MNHVSQTQNLSEILKNILSEIQENNVKVHPRSQ